MPVPGTLKRIPVDETKMIALLESQFDIRPIETKAYLRLLEGHDMTVNELAVSLDLSSEQTLALMDRMVESGLVIRAPGQETGFSPLHPRMTMTNIFKVYEKAVVDALREHRATVDRVVNLLVPIYEERKIQKN